MARDGTLAGPTNTHYEGGIIEGQPQAQTGLARGGVQKGRILVGMYGPSDLGVLENVHGLGYHGVSIAQRRDQLPQFGRRGVFEERLVGIVALLFVVDPLRFSDRR